MTEPKSTESNAEANTETATALSSSANKEVDQKDEDLLVDTPADTDVLCGRGAPINMHPGNVIYRQVVKHNKPLYQTCEKFEKYRVAQSIVEALMGRQPKVRFLEACGNENDGTRSWKIVPKDKAVKKTIQALRERDRKSPKDEAPKRYESMILNSGVPCHIPGSSNIHKYGTEARPDNTGGKEDWQVLFHHLLPEAVTDFKSSQNDHSDENRLTSGIVIDEGQAKDEGTTKVQDKYSIIHQNSGVPVTTGEANKAISPMRNKSVHRLMFDGLSVVEEVAPINSAASASVAASVAASAAASDMSIEGFKANNMESAIVTEVSVEESKTSDDHSCISGYGDAGDAYSINSDFGLSPARSGELAEYSVYQTELAECKNKAKSQEQWNYDMDFETMEDQVTTPIKGEGN
mmetsp:Transcript_12625/g.19419  ORF Transcript_12625/g.19419 Transcript_12625/m.19419 type:complete len:406 (+) Transcript_12625:111-1328(+)